MRLLVTGASGLLGVNLCLVAAKQGFHVSGLYHSHGLTDVPFDLYQVNLLKIDEALRTIDTIQPEAIIHCAALANLNVAEQNPELAHQLNCEVPGTLAEYSANRKVPFIQISTDAVFGGRTEGYTEDDPVYPRSVYAQTKLDGEEEVRKYNPDAIIARVVFYGWSLSGNRSLSEFFFNQLRHGQKMKGFTDVMFCPLYVEDLAITLLEMLNLNLAGVYHVVSPEHLSKYEFGVRIARKFGYDPDLIEPTCMADVVRGAPRSTSLILKPDKVQTALGHLLPNIDMGIEKMYQRWLAFYPQRLQGFAGPSV